MNKFERLLQIESEFDLHNLDKNGVWYYPIVKQNLFVYDLSGNKSTEGTVNKKSVLNKLGNIIFIKNKPLLHSDFLIIDSATSRRLNPETQNYESFFTDYLYQLFSEYSLSTLERPNEIGENHFKKSPPYVNLIFPDKEFLKIIINSKLHPVKFSKEEELLLNEIISFLNADKNIINFIAVKLSRFFYFYQYYVKLLNKINPRLIFIINAYNYANMAMILAAKQLGIKTIEMQHGFIREDHPGYIWKNITDKKLFPDYFFSYGEYFTNLLKEKSVLFNSAQIFTCGAYSIEKTLTNLLKKQSKKNNSKEIIYITSQWSVRDELKLFVLKLSAILPERFVIKYKTHPLEKDVGNFYSEFKNIKNIILVDNPNINSLDLMPQAVVHSTAYSTSFMEANFLGIPNIFIFIDGYSQVISKFIDNLTIFSAETPEIYLQKLNYIINNRDKIISTINQRKDFFYKPNAGKNIREAVNKILGQQSEE